jgi:hypothetical protein
VDYVRFFWESGREGGRGTNARKAGKKNLLPLPLRVKGRRRYTVPFKTTLFRVFFIHSSYFFVIHLLYFFKLKN